MSLFAMRVHLFLVELNSSDRNIDIFKLIASDEISQRNISLSNLKIAIRYAMFRMFVMIRNDMVIIRSCAKCM